MNCTTDNEDNECIRRCLAGDADAFEGLVVRYQRPVFNVILRMVQNREDASELCQSAFLKAYLNLAAFETGRKFFSWICRIAMNDSINFLSSRRPSEPVPADYQSSEANPAETLEANELKGMIDDAIALLSPEHRSVIVLRHFTQCSYEEIAETLHIPEKTVKSRLFDARRTLRDRLVARGYARRLSHA
ncbi:MAG: sigma-70 family RNA polymerase sigma factor [Thermoanaerobaculia bacterium]|jgi:RNA polymerase sigma-70 factor (ECF subfamily)